MRQANKIYTNPQLKLFCEGGEGRVYLKKKKRIARNGKSLTNWVQFSSVQSLSCVWLFTTPRTAARQASLSITNSRSLLKLNGVGWVKKLGWLLLLKMLLLTESRYWFQGWVFLQRNHEVDATLSFPLWLLSLAVEQVTKNFTSLNQLYVMKS